MDFKTRKVCNACRDSELHLKPADKTSISSNKASLTCYECKNYTCKKHTQTLCNMCYQEETN